MNNNNSSQETEKRPPTELIDVLILSFTRLQETINIIATGIPPYFNEAPIHMQSQYLALTKFIESKTSELCFAYNNTPENNIRMFLIKISNFYRLTIIENAESITSNVNVPCKVSHCKNTVKPEDGLFNYGVCRKCCLNVIIEQLKYYRTGYYVVL